MASGWEALSAPEYASAVRVAAAVAADMLADQLAEAGLDERSATAFLVRLRATALPDLSAQEALAFGNVLQESLATVAEQGGPMAARVRAADQFERDGGAVTRGWGGDVAMVIMAVAFLAAVLNTDIKAGHDGFDVHMKAGVPPGMSDLLRSVAAMISGARATKPEPRDGEAAPRG